MECRRLCHDSFLCGCRKDRRPWHGAGGGMVAKAASIDRRIKTVATASAVNVGCATRKGWDGNGSEATLMATLEALAKSRSAEAAAARPRTLPTSPNSVIPA